MTLLVALSMAGLPLAAPAHADEVTVSHDAQRTGWDPNEPALTAGAVTGSDFGQLFSTAVVGQVYAQPLVVGSTVIVGTEENHVYGLDSRTGAIRWQAYLGPAWPSSTVGCGSIVPDIGITSAPVYDPTSGYVYLTAKVNDGTSVAAPHYYLFALNAATGAIPAGWPVAIGGSPSNDPTTTFQSEWEFQRSGLLFQNGSVYMAFGGHCDDGSYRGYVVGVNTSTKSQHLWTTEAGPGASGAGIWQSGGGIASDGANGIFIASGNGVTPPVGAGTSPPKTLSESVVHLTVAADGTISASDFFAPANATVMDANDQDLASGAPVSLPDAQFGTAAHPHLLLQVGKDGRLFILDRTSLGGRGQGANGTDKVVGLTQLSGVWGHPGVWGGDGGYVYVDETSTNHLVALAYGLTGTGQPSFRVAGTSKELLGYGSGSPVVTSNGTTPGSALVWVIQSGAQGNLLVYNAVPSNGVLTLLRSWPVGPVSSFSVPATDGGRVYVGTHDGHVLGFGAPTPQALQGNPVSFGNVAVGATGSATATLTANTTVTVSAISAAAPYTTGASTPALPVTLTAGQSLSVPITFTPTTWGANTGQLTLTTDQGQIELGLTGTGTQPGLGAVPASLAWGSRAVGSTETLTLGVTNTGTTAETFTGVTGPGGAFTAAGLPAVGTSLAAGGTITISATYAPTAVSAGDSSSIVLTTDQGSVTIPLTGSAIAAAPQVTITPMSLAFGNVGVGGTGVATFTVSNTGNVNLTITKAAPPALPFVANNPIPEGQQLAPGQSYTESLKFLPTAIQAYTGSYEVSTDTGQGPMYIKLTGTGQSVSGQLFDSERAASGTLSTWQLEGPSSASVAQSAVTAMPDGSTQLLAATTSGGLEIGFRSAAGVWGKWLAFSQSGVSISNASIAGMPDGSSQLVEVTSTGVMKHNIRYASGAWQAAGWTTPVGSTHIAQAAITAMPDGSTQFVAVTTSGVLEHNIRYANGSWQGWHALSQSGVIITGASIAGMPDGSSQIIEVTSTGVLKHNIRYASGAWQTSGWASPVGSTHIAQAAITAMSDGSAQLVAVTTGGVLEHNIRGYSGAWQTSGWDVPAQTKMVAAVTSSGIARLANGAVEIIEISR
jgi:hypothetical protein